MFIDYIYPKELIGIFEEKIEDAIKTDDNTKLISFYRSDHGYKKLKKSIENELFSRIINYKQCERFINTFIQSFENRDNTDKDDFNKSDRIDEIKQNFGEIDNKYLVLRKKQYLINRVDIIKAKESEYFGYGKFVIG